MWNGLNTLLVRLMTLSKDERGVTLVEYGFILSLVSVAAIGLLEAIGQDVTNPVPQLLEALKRI